MPETTDHTSRDLEAARVKLNDGRLGTEEIARGAKQAAEHFLTRLRDAGVYSSDDIALLCEMAAHTEPQIAQAGVAGLFPHLVERLNDSFEPESCALYDRVFAQVIEFCRRRPEGRALDDMLRRFGLRNETDILLRKSQLPDRASKADERQKVRKVLLLSRVTLGADVTVTSVIMSALQQSLPQAELVLLGSGKLRQLFGGDERVRIREIAYERSSTLISRLNSWLEVVGAVEAERAGYSEDELWVIDPDSRLTQLGLLPVVAGDAGYFFFESRSYRQPRNSRLSQLTQHWINQLRGSGSQVFPYVALPAAHQFSGQQVVQQLRSGGARHVVCVSFGVGGNERKRMPDPFEEELINGLLADSTLIIDKGAGEDERRQISHLVSRLKSQGRSVIEANESKARAVLAGDSIRADVMTWEGSIGAFAGLIAASDEYVGYDSAGQHIAAASGIPTLTIFVNSGSTLFAERWHPHGPGAISVVKVEPGSDEISEEQMKAVLAEAQEIHRSLWSLKK